MSEPRLHLKALEEIERTALPGLVEVLRTEGIEGVRYALWDMTGWHRDYSKPPGLLVHLRAGGRSGGCRLGRKRTRTTVMSGVWSREELEKSGYEPPGRARNKARILGGKAIDGSRDLRRFRRNISSA